VIDDGFERGSDADALHLAVTNWDQYISAFGGRRDTAAELMLRMDAFANGILNYNDVNVVMDRLGVSLGDFNQDDQVDLNDYSHWQANYGLSGATFRDGDANFDGQVDDADHDEWHDRQAEDNLAPQFVEVVYMLSAGTEYTDIEIASSEHTTVNGPQLVIERSADIDVTQFDTSGTQMRVGFQVLDEDHTSVNLQLYRRDVATQTLAAVGDAISLGNLSEGYHEHVFTPNVGTEPSHDYEWVVEVSGTASSVTNSDEAAFEGGVFFDTMDRLHIHGGDGSDVVTVTADGVHVEGVTSVFIPTDSSTTLIQYSDDFGDLTADGPNVEHRFGAVAFPHSANTQAWDHDFSFTVSNIVPEERYSLWTFNDLSPGFYRVSASWLTAYGSSSANADYYAFDGGQFVAATTANQQSLPSQFSEVHPDVATLTWFDDLWQSVYVGSGSLQVMLPNASDGYVTADAIRIEQVAIDMTETMFIHLHGGDDVVSAHDNHTGRIEGYGGSGEDMLVGGAGNDDLRGGMGADIIFGGDGNDTLYGYDTTTGYVNDGSDTIYGQNGDDSLYVDYYDSSNGTHAQFDQFSVIPNGGDIYNVDGDDVAYGQVSSVAAPPSSSWSQGMLWQGDFGFGEGWNLPSVDRIDFTGVITAPTTMEWVRTDGHTVAFAYDSVQSNWRAVSGDPTDSVITIENGQLVRRDKFGGVAEYSSASTGLALLTSNVDRLGNGIEYSWGGYSTATFIDSVTTVRQGQLDETTIYTYGTNGHVQYIDDPWGRRVEVFYDTNGRLLRFWNDSQNLGVSNIQYNTSTGMISSISNADSRTRSFSFEQSSFTWNHLELQVDDAGPGDFMRYSGAPSNVFSYWRPQAGIWEMYLPDFRLTDGLDGVSTPQQGYQIDAMGRMTLFTVNPDGAITELVDPTGRTTDIAVNSAGLPTEITTLSAGDQRTVDEVTIGYDSRFNATSITYFDGTSENWTFDPNFSQVTSHTDELLRTTIYTVNSTTGNTDSIRRVVNALDGTGGINDDIVLEFEYTADGLVEQAIALRYDIDGTPLTSSVTQYSYTTVSATTGAGHTSRWLNSTTIAGDDPSDSVVTLISPAVAEITARDQYGNPTAVDDPLDHTTTFTHDSRNRQTGVTGPSPGGYGDRFGVAYGQTSTVTMTEYTDSGNLYVSYSGGTSIGPGEVNVQRFGPVDYNDCDCVVDFWIDGRDSLGNLNDFGINGETFAYNPDHSIARYADSYVETTFYVQNAAGQSIFTSQEEYIPVGLGDEFNTYTDPVLAGYTTFGNFNARGEQYAYRDQSGNVTALEYDRRGRLVELSSGGSVLANSYDAAGQLISRTDAEGRTTSYTYDDAGRVLTMLAPGYTIPTQYQYDSLGNVRIITDPLGHATTYTYDERGRVTSITDANGDTTSFTYHNDDQIHTLTDANGNTTTWEYDDAGRVASETNELGHTTFYKYDGLGRLWQVFDRNGRLTEFLYDAFGQVASEIWYTYSTAPTVNPSTWHNQDWLSGTSVVETISYEWDGRQQLITASSSDATYYYNYDYLGRQQWSAVEYAALDIDGRFTGVTEFGIYQNDDRQNLDIDFQFDHDFDDEGRMTTSRLIFGGISTTVNGNADDIELPTLQTDPDAILDYQNTYAYDSLDRLIQTVRVGQTSIDHATNAVAETRIDFAYNRVGQFTSIRRYASETTDEAVATSSWQYDATGRISSFEHRQGALIGAGTLLAGYAYSFDSSHRLTGIDFLPTAYDDEDVTYTYDDRGQVTGADYTGTGQNDESYVYDDNGNREGSQTTGLGTSVYAAAGTNNQLLFDGTYRYEYDGEGNRVLRYIDGDGSGTLTNGDTDVTRYSWDHRNRLVGVEQFESEKVDLTSETLVNYDGQTGGGGYTGTYSLPDSETISLDGNIWRALPFSYTVTANTVLEFDFSSSTIGEIHAIGFDTDLTLDSTATRRFFQLAGSQTTVWKTWRPWENSAGYSEYQSSEGVRHYRIEVGQFVTGAFNYLIFANDNDATGQVDGIFSNIRIYEASDAWGDPLAQSVDYAYDAFNQLIGRTIDADGDFGSAPIEQTAFIWDGGQQVLQFDKTGSGDIELEDMSHRYLWGAAVDQLMADEQIDWTDTNADGADDAATDNDLLWALTDHLGTVRDVIDNDASYHNHRRFDSFGNLLAESNTTFEIAFGFTGKYFDEVTGQQYNLRRWYDPTVGQWLSEDPIGFDGLDTNLARYAANAATMYTDPTGEIIPVLVGIAVIGGVIFVGDPANAPGPNDVGLPSTGGLPMATFICSTVVGGSIGGHVAGWIGPGRPIVAGIGGGAAGGGAGGFIIGLPDGTPVQSGINGAIIGGVTGGAGGAVLKFCRWWNRPGGVGVADDVPQHPPQDYYDHGWPAPDIEPPKQDYAVPGGYDYREIITGNAVPPWKL
jgi:RHS repeat-associated protein